MSMRAASASYSFLAHNVHQHKGKVLRFIGRSLRGGISPTEIRSLPFEGKQIRLDVGNGVVNAFRLDDDLQALGLQKWIRVGMQYPVSTAHRSYRGVQEQLKQLGINWLVLNEHIAPTCICSPSEKEKSIPRKGMCPPPLVLNEHEIQALGKLCSATGYLPRFEQLVAKDKRPAIVRGDAPHDSRLVLVDTSNQQFANEPLGSDALHTMFINSIVLSCGLTPGAVAALHKMF